MAKNRSPIPTALTNPGKYPFIFLFFITIVTAVLGNGVSGLLLDTLCAWLDQYTPLTKWGWQMIVVIILILVLIFNIASLPALVQRVFGKRPPYDSKVKPMGPAVSCRGLIVFMSAKPRQAVDKPRQATAAESAILHHWQKKPRTISHCWIICGGTTIEKDATDMLANFLVEQKKSMTFVYGDCKYPNPDDLKHPLSLLLPSQSIDDPNHIRQVIEAIYVEAEEKFGLAENEILLDYTGGNKSMTAGAVLAGADPDRRLEYMHTDYDKEGKADWSKTEMMAIDISYRVKPLA
jgi:CRISPR-associated protein (Cas_Cas02710)